MPGAGVTANRQKFNNLVVAVVTAANAVLPMVYGGGVRNDTKPVHPRVNLVFLAN